MERTEKNMIEIPAEQEIELSAKSCVRAMVEQSAARNAVKAIQASADEQIRREAKTRALAPDAYRLSTLTEIALNLQYRRGKEYMSSEDLVRYIRDTRTVHLRAVDLTEATGIDECSGGNTKESCTALIKNEERTEPSLIARARKLSTQLGTELKTALPTWFDASEPDTTANSRRFPLSAFAAILAVAMSLLLIVASSVMVRLAESDVSRLKTQISDMTSQANDLKSDYEVGTDLLQIRQIAKEEYGMVDEDYLKMDYVSLLGEDSVEAYEERREESIGLAALLSAIGIK